MRLLRPTRYRNVVVACLFAISAVAFMDRTNISIAGPQLRNEFALNNVQLGWIISAFLIGYACFQVVAGMLACKLGPRIVLAGALILWSGLSALTASVGFGLPHALVALILLRFLLGISESVVYPAANQMVARWLPQQELGRANGWIFAGVGAGAGLSIPWLAWLNHHSGWRASFYFCALAGLVAALVWWSVARDSPEQHAWVHAAEREHILVTRPQGKAARGGNVSRQGLRSLLLLTGSYFMFGYVAWLFFGWFFLYLADARHLDLKTNAVASMIPFLAMAIFCPIGGIINDAVARRSGLRAGRCGVSVIAFALTAALLLVGSRVHSPAAACLVLGGGAGALYLSQSSFWSVSADLAGARSGWYSGIMNLGNQLGAALTASLTPYFAVHFSWGAAFACAASAAMVGGILWLFIDPSAAGGATLSDDSNQGDR